MKFHFTLLLIFVSSSLLAQDETAPFIKFLGQQELTPKEYIFELFKTSDIVILGERDHRDTTQYDLIQDILSDPRFIENIGHVYTEVGVVNHTEWANKVVKGDYENEETFQEDFVTLYRELDWHELWGKYNMVKYLKGVYAINQELPEDKKITIGLTDCAFDWNGMTHEKYQEFSKKNLYANNARDSVMAQNFAELYENQEPINGHKKALLIQSRPHAINLNTTFERVKTKRVGAFIKERYGDNAKIVVFNWYHWVPPEWTSKRYGQSHVYELSADGKWDAAFEMTGKEPRGFDIENTPFGETPFDYTYDEEILYQDIADGVIFYLPFYEFVCTRGLPGIVDRKFAKEYIRRNDIVNGDNSYSKEYGVREEYKDWNIFRGVDCNDYEAMKEQMNKWIDK